MSRRISPKMGVPQNRLAMVIEAGSLLNRTVNGGEIRELGRTYASVPKIRPPSVLSEGVIHQFEEGELWTMAETEDRYDASGRVKNTNVPGLGNCLFHSIHYHLHDTGLIEETMTPENIRQDIVAYLLKYPGRYGAVRAAVDPVGDPEEREYRDKELMKRDGVWGGEDEIEAAADLYGVTFQIWQKASNSRYYQSVMQMGSNKRQIFDLIFENAATGNSSSGNHYRPAYMRRLGAPADGSGIWSAAAHHSHKPRHGPEEFAALRARAARERKEAKAALEAISRAQQRKPGRPPEGPPAPVPAYQRGRQSDEKPGNAVRSGGQNPGGSQSLLQRAMAPGDGSRIYPPVQSGNSGGSGGGQAGRTQHLLDEIIDIRQLIDAKIQISASEQNIRDWNRELNALQKALDTILLSF